MKTKSLIAIFVGLVAVCLLVIWQGLETVAGLLAEGGWPILLVCLFALPDQGASAAAWRVLFPVSARPGAGQALAASWMGSAVNNLLPVATIGGEVVKARVITFWSYSVGDAVSTVIVDKTVQAIAVLLWALVGIAMLAWVSPEKNIVVGALTGAGLLALGIGGFIAAQVFGGVSFIVRSAAKISGHQAMNGFAVGADALDQAIREIYRRVPAVALSCAWRLAGGVMLVGEIPLAAYLMGRPIGLAEAVLIYGLIVGLRGVAFAVPGALGVQEGGYMAIGALIGIPVDLMLTVSLVTRVREILPNIPFLIAWQHMEGRALFRRRAGAPEMDKPPGPGKPEE